MKVVARNTNYCHYLPIVVSLQLLNATKELGNRERFGKNEQKRNLDFFMSDNGICHINVRLRLIREKYE